MAWLLVAFAIVWLWHLGAVSLVPPGDNIEQINWSRSLEWGYYKHPPLPTWLFAAAASVFGASAQTSYVLGAAVTLAACALLWGLMARLRSPGHATLTLLACLCVTFYNGRLYYYNHNTVLMLWVVLAGACTWQAFASGRRGWWWALGVVFGLGVLTKYQIAVAGLSTAAFWLTQRGWRLPAQRWGLALSGVLALAVAAPHLAWLPLHGYGPIGYAMHSSLGVGLTPVQRVTHSLHWLADQLFNRALPAWLLLWSLRAAWRRATPANAGWQPVPPRAAGVRAFLLCFGALPLAFMTALGLLAGVGLQLHWGTPFLPFTVALAVDLMFGARRGWTTAFWRRAAVSFLLLQAVLLGISQLTSPFGPARWRDHHWRAFDAPVLAQDIGPPARELLGGPVRVVIGDTHLAGAVALYLPEHPRVLIDGRYDLSPWVDPEQVENCGALWVGPLDDDELAEPVGPDFPNLGWRVIDATGSASLCR